MSVGVDKPWPRLVARLRAAGIHPNITQVAVETALLREAADALEAAESATPILGSAYLTAIARAEVAEAHLRAAQDQDSLTIEKLQEALAAAEARAEEAIQWIGVVRDELVIAGFPGGDRDVALANIRTLLTGRRVIAENAAVLERLGTSGDHVVPEQAHPCRHCSMEPFVTGEGREIHENLEHDVAEVERVRWLIDHHATPLETHHNAKPDPDRCDFCAVATRQRRCIHGDVNDECGNHYGFADPDSANREGE